MRKHLSICGKEYDVCSSAYCMFLYKKEFGTGILEDISKLNSLQIKQMQVQANCEKENLSKEETEALVNNVMLSELDNVISIALQIAYIFIKFANPKFKTFNEWTQEIEEIELDDSWIAEVTEMAVNTFCGQRINRAK
jgi:hypothetical protein